MEIVREKLYRVYPHSNCTEKHCVVKGLNQTRQPYHIRNILSYNKQSITLLYLEGLYSGSRHAIIFGSMEGWNRTWNRKQSYMWGTWQVCFCVILSIFAVILQHSSWIHSTSNSMRDSLFTEEVLINQIMQGVVWIFFLEFKYSNAIIPWKIYTFSLALITGVADVLW